MSDACPECAKDDISGTLGIWTFEKDGVKLRAHHVLWKCEDCGHRFVKECGQAQRDAIYAEWKRNSKAA